MPTRAHIAVTIIVLRCLSCRWLCCTVGISVAAGPSSLSPLAPIRPRGHRVGDGVSIHGLCCCAQLLECLLHPVLQQLWLHLLLLRRWGIASALLFFSLALLLLLLC